MGAEDKKNSENSEIWQFPIIRRELNLVYSFKNVIKPFAFIMFNTIIEMEGHYVFANFLETLINYGNVLTIELCAYYWTSTVT